MPASGIAKTASIAVSKAAECACWTTQIRAIPKR
jgi:hypothetical protein